MGIYKSATKIAKDHTLNFYYERDGDEVGIRCLNVSNGLHCIDGTLTGLGGSMQSLSAEDQAVFTYVDDGGGTQGYVYLRLHGAVDPNTVHIKIPTPGACFEFIGVDHAMADGLVWRYFGNSTAPVSAATYCGGITLNNASDIVIKNCSLSNTSGYVLSVDGDSTAKNRIVIADNTFRDRGLGADDYADPVPPPKWGILKQSVYENLAISFFGSGISISNNEIGGEFNGWSVIGHAPTSYPAGFMAANETNATTIEGMEIIGNTFRGIGDDACEPEQWMEGLTIADNLIHHCYKGISMAPVSGGLIMVVRNRWLGRGEYVDQSDQQNFLKAGNDDPGDTGRKIVAYNTAVNIGTDTGKKGLFGFMNSGAGFNLKVLANIMYCDELCVFGYGAFSYPRIFDYNRYKATRLSDTTGYDGALVAGFAIYKKDLARGEPFTGSQNYQFLTFTDWQTGNANGTQDLPGAVGTVHTSPVIALTPGASNGGTVYPPTEAYWLNDPHGSYEAGGHELVDPDNLDFRPIAGNSEIEGAGVVLANITYDNGPYWTRYNEGSPTLGAEPLGAPAPSDTTDPTPGTVTVSAITQTTATVNMGAGSDNVGVDHRTLGIYSDSARTVLVGLLRDPAADVTNLTGLTPGATYYIRARWYDVVGNFATVESNFTTASAVLPPQGATAVRSLVRLGALSAGGPPFYGVSMIYHKGDTGPDVFVETIDSVRVPLDLSAFYATVNAVYRRANQTDITQAASFTTAVLPGGTTAVPGILIPPPPTDLAANVGTPVNVIVRFTTSDGTIETAPDELQWVIKP
jgi:hypothetical protein